MAIGVICCSVTSGIQRAVLVEVELVDRVETLDASMFGVRGKNWIVYSTRKWYSTNVIVGANTNTNTTVQFKILMNET